MSEGKKSALFESKVAELIAVTQGLGVAHILLLRRMTLADPESRKWAAAHELKVVFDVILKQALALVPTEDLDAASLQHFDPFVPPGPDDVRDQEGWMLFDMTRSRLTPRTAATEPAVPVIPDPEVVLEDDTPIEANDFSTLFDETIARYVRRTLSVLPVTGSRPYVPVPFVLATAFAPVFEDVLRRFLLPDMRLTKRVKALAASRSWEGSDSGRLIAMIQAGGTTNAILESWDSRWGGFQSQGVGSRIKPGHDPWVVFREAATAGGYTVPGESDIPLLRLILRWEAETMAEAWRAIAQTYQQEFHPKDRSDQVRAGAFRDALIKWIGRLPAHGGDILAIRAFFDLPKCDKMFLKSTIQSVGSIDKERRRIAPVLIHFFENLPK